MTFWFQVICLLVTLVTVFAYVMCHVYSREHRLLPLFLGVLAVYDFYRIVLYLTGAQGIFEQLENMLILTLMAIISYYAMDYLHIKIPHVLHVGLFLYLLLLLLAMFLYYDEPQVYMLPFSCFTCLNALFVVAGALYSFRTNHFSRLTNITNALMFVAICVPAIVGSMWQVGASHGRTMLQIVCLCSCLIIMYLIFSNRLVATSVIMQQNAFANAGVAQFLLDTNLELIAANQMALDIFLDGEEFRDYEDVHHFFLEKRDQICVCDGGMEEYVYRGKTYECRENGRYASEKATLKYGNSHDDLHAGAGAL